MGRGSQEVRRAADYHQGSKPGWEENGGWWVSSYKGKEGKEGGADSLGLLLG